jgi:ribosome biogenesis GTPase A
VRQGPGKQVRSRGLATLKVDMHFDFLFFQVMLQYNIPDYRNSLEFITLLAKKRGYLMKGGVANMEQSANTFLDDWTG